MQKLCCVILLIIASYYANAQSGEDLLIPPKVEHIANYWNAEYSTLIFNQSSSKNISYYLVCEIDDNGNEITWGQISHIGDGSQTGWVNWTFPSNFNKNEVHHVYMYAVDINGNKSEKSNVVCNLVLNITRLHCSDTVLFTWNEDFEKYHSINGYFLFIYNNVSNVTSIDIPKNTYSYKLFLPSTGVNRIYLNAQSDVITRTYVSNPVKIPEIQNLTELPFDIVSYENDNTKICIYPFSNQFESIELWRKINDDNFVLIQENLNKWNYPNEKIIDNISSFNNDDNIYTYYIKAYNSCTYDTLYSDTITAMQLHIKTENDKQILYWNKYNKEWVSHYEIYYYEDDYNNVKLLASTTNTNYIKDLNKDLDSWNTKCYYVKAVNTNKMLSANSSTVCLKFETLFYIPNTFMPQQNNVTNNVFKPFCYFVEFNTYNMQIFNRWGEKLFETNNPQEGWDGTYKNAYCKGGTYIYIIKYIDDKGKQNTKTGTFILLN